MWLHKEYFSCLVIYSETGYPVPGNQNYISFLLMHNNNTNMVWHKTRHTDCLCFCGLGVQNRVGGLSAQSFTRLELKGLLWSDSTWELFQAHQLLAELCFCGCRNKVPMFLLAVNQGPFVLFFFFFKIRQKYRSMEQNRKPRDKSTNLWSPYLRQRRQGYTMEKRQPF